MTTPMQDTLALTPTMARPAVRLATRPDGIAVMTFDTPDSPVNILSRSFFGDFAACLDAVLNDPAIRGCVLASAKKDSFIAGANIHEFLGITDAAEAEKISRDGHALLGRMASSAKPFVAAIHGPALGGGLEVALACHVRIASDSPKTQLALPEVTLGLLPGGGGCVRLPRLIGLQRALPMLLTGKKLRARQARRAGLVDFVTSPRGIVDVAAAAALRFAAGELRLKREPSTMDRVLASPLARGFVLRKARADVMAKTHGLYPAPLAILDCVEASLERGFDAGREAESRGFGRLVASPEAKSLLWLFTAMTDLKKSPVDAKPREVASVAVLGAGFMGEGVAGVTLPFAQVALKDIGADALGRGAKALRKSLDGRMKSGSLTRLDRDRHWACLALTTQYADCARADLVVEAVFEKLELKQQVLAETEAVLRDDAVFASNTSALPIGAIAANAKRPERVLGMHYFSPVHKMPLLEIIVTPRTADWATATAHAVGTRQGKTCIVVKDGPGFYTTRILMPYMNEAMRVLEEGAAVEDIDKALVRFGFPVGPMTLADEVGLDVGAHVGRDLGAAFAARGMATGDALFRIVDSGMLGRKSGRGFYLYDSRARGGAKIVNTEVYQYAGGKSRQVFPSAEVAERVALLMVNEAAHCLGEGIIASARDGDIGAVLGLGFPAFRGGPFHYIDAVGAANVVAKLDALAQTKGPRFLPAPVLRDVAGKGLRFY